MSDFDKSFKRTQNTIKTGMIVSVIMAILILVAMIGGCGYAIKKISEHGLKGCIESIWNGPSTNAPSTH